MMTPTDYKVLYDFTKLRQDPIVQNTLDYICRVILTHKEIYQDVERATKVPWLVVAAIHYRESSQDFTKHLHNGDPLSAKTVHVPAGRPAGEPPYTWAYSACDALAGMWRPTAWVTSTALEFCERYNGLGYQKLNVNSPYVWCWTTAYLSGLFVADGKYDPKSVNKAAGCAAIFKALALRGESLDVILKPN
jgi:lysozyme family protein